MAVRTKVQVSKTKTDDSYAPTAAADRTNALRESI